MSKKKIIHIIQSLNNGGCENMLLRTLPLLDNFEHKIIALKELGELTPKFVSAGITVETIHCDSIFDVPGIRRLRKIVREENPDIILTYLFHADMIGRFFLQNCTETPVIPFLRTTYNHPKYLIARILEWFTKPLVSQYLANSVAVKNFYVDSIGVQPEKITVIPNGIDSECFDSITSDPRLKQSLGVKPNDFVIICVANLHPNKGHKYLLEAFEQFYTSPHSCHPGLDPGSSPKQTLKLLLVGEGPEKENLKKQIINYSSKEGILFLGKRTDVPQLLKISNTFILPTLFEGMSNAIMEAMTCGLPIITTNIDENKELIEDGQTGVLVPTKNSAAICEAIKSILENPEFAENLSKNAKLFIGENFSLSKVAAQRSLFFNLTKMTCMENELYEKNYKDPKHFSFGKNWQNFLKDLNEKKIQEAENSLIDFLGGKENIIGKSFVDIGCGSGLFSLAAYRLGAKKIISVDIDDFSVACAKYLHEKNGKPEQWKIKTGSALDQEFLKSLGVFNLVYSWGVLHHTGNMYQALENVASLIAPNGKLYIAIYNDNRIFLEGTSNFWHTVKKWYNKKNQIQKKMAEIIYSAYYIIGLTLHLINPVAYIRNYHSLRGMNFLTDIKDWLGGYPYEFAYPQKIISYFESNGFVCVKTHRARSIGCNEFLFMKKL